MPPLPTLNLFIHSLNFSSLFTHTNTIPSKQAFLYSRSSEKKFLYCVKSYARAANHSATMGQPTMALTTALMITIRHITANSWESCGNMCWGSTEWYYHRPVARLPRAGGRQGGGGTRPKEGGPRAGSGPGGGKDSSRNHCQIRCPLLHLKVQQGPPQFNAC